VALFLGSIIQFGLAILDNTDFNKNKKWRPETTLINGAKPKSQKQKVETRNHFNKRGETEKPDE